ncbi:class II aldolase/adducin family protein [bacterium]|nr:class II aldolase/adducin family protein [bacterium]
MIDEGYIKYTQHFIEDQPVHLDEIKEINAVRTRLYQKKLIGAYDDVIGYGNISKKNDDGTLLISGTQTGQIAQLDARHYTTIVSYDIEKNSLTCRGPIKASSESLTHAAVYELSPEIKAVIHIHSAELWKKHLHILPTTAPEITYGTPEMALEVKRLYREGPLKETHIMIMAGHEEGIFTFGRNFKEAMDLVMQL